MHVYHSTTNNPYFNIATEEYFLKNYSDDFFVLYINEPSIIVGKHQNTMAEINVPYVFEKGLKVVRRLSGGGTVFHDYGNLNYCFIQSGKEGYLVDFKKYAQPVLDTLQNLEVNAWLRGKSDLVIDDLKFSGNAEHVFKNRILHHGTLLFNANLEHLNESIKADWNNFSDRAVRSNRSMVTNITDHLKKKLTIHEFQQKVIDTVLQQNQDLKPFELSESDKIAIEKLVTEKYSTWKWNFAYSPNYQFTKTVALKSGVISSKIEIEKGVIKKLYMDGDITDINQNMQYLIGKPHQYLVVQEFLNAHTEEKIRMQAHEILKVLF